MGYHEDFTEFEAKMIGLVRTMRGAVGKDRSLFVLAAAVRRTRRLLRALEHELDWAVADFLDGWPGTEEGYNSLDRLYSVYAPSDSARFEQGGELRMVPGYDAAQWVPENLERLEIVPFAERDVNSFAHSHSLLHAKAVMEAGYKEADDASPAVTSYLTNQTVTEDQLLTWYHRGREHQAEIDRAEKRTATFQEAQAERKRRDIENRKPEAGWSIFDWNTGERVAPATVEQVKAFQEKLEASGEPVLVDTDDPAITTNVGWRQALTRVKQGRKWVTQLSGPHHRPAIERPVRVGRNELTTTTSQDQ